MGFYLEATLEKHPSEKGAEEHAPAFFKADAAPRFCLQEISSQRYALSFLLPEHEATWTSSSSVELWRGTCFEFFLKSGSYYWEWNWNLEEKHSCYSLRTWRQALWKQEASGLTGLSNIFYSKNKIKAELSPAVACPQWSWILSCGREIEWQACCILKDNQKTEHWSSRHSDNSSPDFHSSKSFKPWRQ